MSLRVDVLTIFPAYLEGPASLSLLGRAREQQLLDLRVHDLRAWATGRHRAVDDAPYGGGPGMVMRADVWVAAAEAVWNASDDGGARHVAGGSRPRTLMFTPRGRPFDQAMAASLATERRLVLCCGRYEGIDERAHELVATDDVSIGDYVLMGGEAAALVVLEAVTRLLPGVLGNAESPLEESFGDGRLEYPQYTRPESVRGVAVPEILRSGDHGRIRSWRRDRANERTRARRPDLLDE